MVAMELNEEQKSALLKYEELKIVVKDAEAQMAELKPIVLEAVPEGTKINASQGYFERKKRDNWKFGPGIELQEKALKEAKEGAVARGEATNNPTVYIEYRTGKPKVKVEGEE